MSMLSVKTLSSADSKTIHDLRKFNSHTHLGGEIPLKNFASNEQLKLIQQQFDRIATGELQYKDVFYIFGMISQLVNTHEKLQAGTFEALMRMKADNNDRVLLRTGLKIVEDQPFESYLKTVLAGVQQAEDAASDFSVRLMLSLNRASPKDPVEAKARSEATSKPVAVDAKTTVDLAIQYKDLGVIGIDISDVCTLPGVENIIPELQRAKAAGLKIAVHMGELSEEKDQMVIINALKPDLIDHGVNLNAEASQWVKDHNVAVTVCLTSSKATNMHPKGTQHPQLVDCLGPDGLSDGRIHFGTDDSTVFSGITLSSELESLYPNMPVEKIVQLATNSFEYAEKLFSQHKKDRFYQPVATINT